MKYGALEAVAAIEHGEHHLVDVRWNNSYDGSTKWHPLSDEKDSRLREGVFPLQAGYRVREGE